VLYPHTERASASAEASHVPANRVAKAVVLKSDDRFMVAVLPASRYIHFGELRQLLGGHVRMAHEEEFERLFRDCEPGAVPALGSAYGLNVLVDDSLGTESDVYVEGGDHASLIRVSGLAFQRLLADARHGQFTEDDRGACREG
jgi:Ala-tRNA(Pro) deacylase